MLSNIDFTFWSSLSEICTTPWELGQGWRACRWRSRGKGWGHPGGLEASRRAWFAGIQESNCCEAGEMGRKREEGGRQRETVWLRMKRKTRRTWWLDAARC